MIETILEMLVKYLKSETYKRGEIFDSKPILHYYQEIIRHWNQLNFILRKTLRSLNIKEIESIELNAKLLYITYRVIFENATQKELSEELSNFQKFGPLIRRLYEFSWDVALKTKSEPEKLSLSNAISTFFIERLSPVMEKSDIIKNIHSMDNLRSKSPITFRINTLIRHGIDYVLEKQIQENFSKSKIKIEKDQDVKYLYRVDSILKNKLLSNKYYREGFLIIQDKCSAAAVDILCPLKEDFILDMCAAPGIKTSFMALLTKNEGRILASEFETNRIHVMRSLLEKFNASNIFYINNDSTINIFREGFKFDKILIDAPCSGSGTFKNHPELKWRQNFNFLNQNLIIQEKLIRSALKLLKRDGILVYSVCSLYPEEGEMQVQKFSQFLIPLKLPLWLSPGYKINGKDVEGTGRCFPSIHGCEGFFISKFKKKE